MAKIVGVHGIGNQLRGENVLHAEWLPALKDGLLRVGIDYLKHDDLYCAFYGDLFRKRGTKSSGIPRYDASDVEEGWEQEMLEVWWRAASEMEKTVPGPEDRTKIRTPGFVQRALNALSGSKFFAGIADRHLMIFNLKQVKSYFRDDRIRDAIRLRVNKAVSSDTRVIIGHSLGSVVAYECLCAHPEWPIKTFITLGSPLGTRNLIFDRLQPAPRDNLGSWPSAVERWVNIADGGDIVASVRNLKPRFGDKVENYLIYNGATAHDVTPYLTAEETGRAVATGLVS
jgi:hypothetical protein